MSPRPLSEEALRNGSLDFGRTATKLSRTPLGIIALFIVLVYAMASIVLVMGRIPADAPVAPLIWFMVLFPVVVFGGFVWLVATRPKNLYGPSDFSEEKHYLALVGLTSVPEQQLLPDTPEGPRPETDGAVTRAVVPSRDSAPGTAVDTSTVEGHHLSTLQGRIEHRKALYEKTRKLFLVHVLKPSTRPNQKYGVGLYVKRHEDGPLTDVKSAEFFLGKSWGNRIIMGSGSGNRIGISTAAFGPFLCTCLVTFTDGDQAMLYRYVDFEMGPLVDAAR